jgi:hypothetical protein
MERRGLQPLARVAISDEKDAPRVLSDFARQKRVGVLCTVDMAGEGYDCPDICVIGFATDKLTPLYVRQVAARAMRVTPIERHKGVIPAAIVVPDVEELVRVLTSYLANELHEVETELGPPGPGGGEGGGPPRYVLEDAELTTETVRVPLGDEAHDVDGKLVRDLSLQLEAVNLRGTDAARFIVAARKVSTEREDTANPFQARTADAAHVEDLSVEENCHWLQKLLSRYEKWWHLHGNSPVATFAGKANDRAGLASKQRGKASAEQLRVAVRFEWDVISQWCEESGKVPPRRR